MAKPFCIPEIEVTMNSFPDSAVAVNMPLAVMPEPLKEKSNVAELANTFWVPASNKITTGNAARSLDEIRILKSPDFANSHWNRF